MHDQYDRQEIEGEDKTNREPNKKHAIKPSAVLRTERNGSNDELSFFYIYNL